MQPFWECAIDLPQSYPRTSDKKLQHRLENRGLDFHFSKNEELLMLQEKKHFKSLWKLYLLCATRKLFTDNPVTNVKIVSNHYVKNKHSHLFSSAGSFIHCL